MKKQSRENRKKKENEETVHHPCDFNKVIGFSQSSRKNNFRRTQNKNQKSINIGH